MNFPRPFLKLLTALFYLYVTLANAVLIDQDKNEYNLIPSAQYWVDPDSKTDPRLLSAAEQNAIFKSPPKISEELNLGFVKGSVWIRLELQNQKGVNKNWVLEAPYLGLDQIDLYMPNGTVFHNGANTPVNRQPYYSRFYAFPVELSEKPQSYYLKIMSTYPITLPLRLIDQHTFNKTQFSENFIQALYFGGLLSLLFYNFVLFIIIRDKKYLLYTLFAAVTGLGIFAGNGYGHLYLWPNSPDWNEISQSVLLSIAASLALLLTMKFLRTRESMPLVDKTMRLLLTGFLLLTLLLICTINYSIPTPPIYMAIFVLTLISPCIALYASIRSSFTGKESISFFMLGWAILCMGSITVALRIFNIIPSNGFTLYALQITSGIEMLLFSFALAHRFQREREDRETAQIALIASKEETVQALRLTEERLEHAVDTRTKKLQELLLSEQYMREQYVRFGAMIAHEFRNPLNIIQAQTTMLSLDKEPRADKVNKRTSVIHGAVDRLVKLFDQWLESDRLSNINTKINVQSIDLQTWLKALVDTCRNYQADHQLILKNFGSTPQVMGDDHLLQIAVLNLIDNACKYSPDRSPIEIGVTRDYYGVGIYVKDAGAGIPENMKAKILEPYVRIPQDNQPVGVGLGLAFVKRIMEAHDGRIQIESSPSGSTITLWLPEVIL